MKSRDPHQPAGLNGYTLTEHKISFVCSLSSIQMGDFGEIGWYIRVE